MKECACSISVLHPGSTICERCGLPLRGSLPKKEPTLWGRKDDERLIHTTVDDLVESILDDYDDTPVPEELTVYGYAPMEIQRSCLSILDNLLEQLDDDYGDPDELSKPTEAMKAAERAFLDVVIKEYKIWSCEIVCSRTINVAEWKKERSKK